MIKCEHSEDGVLFHFRVPIETLRSSSNVEKLAAALAEYFNQPVRVTTEVGAVGQTASLHAQEERAVRQQQAESTIQNDPFVQSMMREFGAIIVPGSIRAT